MKMKRLISVLLVLAGLAAVSVPGVSAEEVKFELKASTTMQEVLAVNTGKKVALRLASGDEIEGTVTMVGNSLVHISRLAGKEFYDAVVSIDRIAAVKMRMRDK